MDYDYVKFDEMLHRHLDEMWRDEEALEIGENISDIPEIKIIFDGYADLETEDEEGNYVYEEGGNKNLESYAIFIHKDSGQENFEFPEHDMTPWGLIHRPEEEVCIYAWYNVEDDEWEINGLYETSDHKMTDEEVMTILETLDKRYFGE
jgi:hypothetical protein